MYPYVSRASTAARSAGGSALRFRSTLFSLKRRKCAMPKGLTACTSTIVGASGSVDWASAASVLEKFDSIYRDLYSGPGEPLYAVHPGRVDHEPGPPPSEHCDVRGVVRERHRERVQLGPSLRSGCPELGPCRQMKLRWGVYRLELSPGGAPGVGACRITHTMHTHHTYTQKLAASPCIAANQSSEAWEDRYSRASK